MRYRFLLAALCFIGGSTGTGVSSLEAKLQTLTDLKQFSQALSVMHPRHAPRDRISWVAREYKQLPKNLTAKHPRYAKQMRALVKNINKRLRLLKRSYAQLRKLKIYDPNGLHIQTGTDRGKTVARTHKKVAASRAAQPIVAHQTITPMHSMLLEDHADLRDAHKDLKTRHSQVLEENVQMRLEIETLKRSLAQRTPPSAPQGMHAGIAPHTGHIPPPPPLPYTPSASPSPTPRSTPPSTPPAREATGTSATGYDAVLHSLRQSPAFKKRQAMHSNAHNASASAQTPTSTPPIAPPLPGRLAGVSARAGSASTSPNLSRRSSTSSTGSFDDVINEMRSSPIFKKRQAAHPGMHSAGAPVPPPPPPPSRPTTPPLKDKAHAKAALKAQQQSSLNYNHVIAELKQKLHERQKQSGH